MVDPGTLTLNGGEITPIQVESTSAFSLPRIIIAPDPNADVTYYQLCDINVTNSSACLDGLIFLPIQNQTGFYGSYIYSLPQAPTTYRVSASACVRADRVSNQGEKTTIVHPSQYSNLTLYCGPSVAFPTAYLQQPAPNEALAQQFRTLHMNQIEMITQFYSLLDMVYSFVSKNSSTKDQLNSLAGTFLAQRENLWVWFTSSLWDQLTLASQTTPSSFQEKNRETLPLAPSCIRNQQWLEAITGKPVSSTLSSANPKESSTPLASSALAMTWLTGIVLYKRTSLPETGISQGGTFLYEAPPILSLPALASEHLNEEKNPHMAPPPLQTKSLNMPPNISNLHGLVSIKKPFDPIGEVTRHITSHSDELLIPHAPEVAPVRIEGFRLANSPSDIFLPSFESGLQIFQQARQQYLASLAQLQTLYEHPSTPPPSFPMDLDTQNAWTLMAQLQGNSIENQISLSPLPPWKPCKEPNPDPSVLGNAQNYPLVYLLENSWICTINWKGNQLQFSNCKTRC